MPRLKKLALFPLIAFSIAGLTACSWDDVEELFEDDDDSSSSGYGYYQYVNLIPQSPEVEFVVEDESLGDIGFTESTVPEYVSTGTYDIEFNQILPNTEDDNFIDDDTMKVTKNSLHSYILYGDNDAPDNYELEIDISDVFDDDFDDGYAMVQFVNLASTDELVDCYLLDADDSLVNKTADYSLSLTDSSGDVEVDEGDYKIVFTESGTDTILAMKDDITMDEGEALAYVLVSYEVAGGVDTTRYSIIELNSEGSRQLSNEAASGYVRISNGITDATSISVGQDSSSNFVDTGVEFGGVSAQITIDITDSDEAEEVDFYLVSDDDDSTVDSFSLDVYADDQVLIISAGDADSSVTVNDEDEDLRIIETHVKLLLSHSIDSESSNDLEVLIIEEGSNVDSYDPEGSIGYLESELYEIEAGDYEIYVYDTDSGDLLVDGTINKLEKGDVVNLTVTDYETGGSPYQIYETFN